MPVSYEDTLTRWDRSRAFGDPRDFKSFANDLEELHPGEGFGEAGQRDGWWTRASTRADTGFFHPLADVTTAPLGEAIGGLFGDRGAEIGRDVGRSIPRMAAQTLPLIAAEALSGGAATPLVLGAAATGGLFGGQTYAETGSPKAALISGAAGALLPSVGKFGGRIGARLLGGAGKFTGEVGDAGNYISDWFPKTTADTGRYTVGRFAGSQAAQIGTLQTSQYLQSRALGQPYDPTDPNFWATQIPFTALDLIHAATGKVPTVEGLKKAEVVKEPEKPYVPPTKASEDETVQATLARASEILQNPLTTPQDREAAVAMMTGVAVDPKSAVEANKLSTPVTPETEVTGYGKQQVNGNWKVLTTDADGKEKTVFVNDVQPTRNEDGTVTFKTKPGDVNENVQSPLTKAHFGIDPLQPELPPQKNPAGDFPWETAEAKTELQPDEQQTLARHGIEPTKVDPLLDPVANPTGTMAALQEIQRRNAPLKEIAQKLEASEAKVESAKAKSGGVPQSVEEIAPLVGQSEVAKPVIAQHVKSGATPTQAVESARLVAQTPQLDEALRQLSVDREAGKAIVQSEWKGKPQAIYGDAVRDEGGKNFETKTLAEAYKESDPDLADYVVRNAGKDKGFYLAKQINKEVSLEGTKLETVLPGWIAPENRPDVSFDDAISSLAAASKEPKVFARVLGLDPNEPLDILRATRLAKQAKTIYAQIREDGKLNLTEVNKELVSLGTQPLADEKAARQVLSMVGQGIDEFNGTHRNFTLDSAVPHDEELTKEMGIREGGIRSVVDWLEKQPTAGMLGVFARDLANAVTDWETLETSFNLREGFRYFRGEKRINIPFLPPSRDTAMEYALKVTHELAHHVGRDLVERSDPAATKFKATLMQVMDALKNAKEIPKEVRKAATLAETQGWYDDFAKSGAGDELWDKFTKVVGPENHEWFGVFYGLQHQDEMLAQVFGDRKMVETMAKVRMPKTLKDTVMNFFSRAWNLAFGGKPLTDSALERLLSGFDDYLSGPKIGPRTLNIRPELSAGENFLYGLAPYDAERNLLGGKHALPKNGQIEEKAFKSIGGVGKPLQDGEVELYRSLVSEAFTNGKVDVPKLVKELKTKGPVVEVRKLGESNTISSTEMQQVQHQLDTWGITIGDQGEPASIRTGAPIKLTQEQQAVFDRALEIQDRGMQGARGNFAFISPKPESKMPGYVEGLVRVPKKPFDNKVASEGKSGSGVTYNGPHFGSEDTNVLAFYRGYEETLPNGTKAFHVIEVQSDWGQKSREDLENRKNVLKGTPKEIRSGVWQFETNGVRDIVEAKTEAEAIKLVSKGRIVDHPLLRVYEILALKAAIAHAKEIGATKVILSDAETAMMTEGHDRAIQHGDVAPVEGWQERVKAAGYTITQHTSDGMWDIRGPDGKTEAEIDSQGVTGSTPELDKLLAPAGYRPSQEKGMRLHYDQTLPSAMEKLTGERGERVGVGAHKYTKPPFDIGSPVESGSPVFRDSSGQPKTQITGRLYDISKVSDKLPLFDTKANEVKIRQSVPYNARDYIRDSLFAKGVRDTALASRVDSIEQLFSKGTLAPSIEGFERETQNGLAPASTTPGALEPLVKTALSSGVPQDIFHGTMNLLAENVPVHADLWWQMKNDVDVATKLYSNIKNGNLQGTLPEGIKENLQLAQVKLNAMRKALQKQGVAMERFLQLGNFTLDGMESTFGKALVGGSLPAPPDPTGLEQEAHEALGLRAATSRTELEKPTRQKIWDFVNRNLMLTQHAKQVIPGVRPVVDHVQQEQGSAFDRMTRLAMVRGFNPETGDLDRNIIKTIKRVEATPSLARAYSDVARWAQEENKARRKWTLNDPFVKEVLGRSGDPKAVLTALQSELRRWEDFNDQIVPQFLAQHNREVTSHVIAARETGMQPDVARDLSEQLYGALGMLKAPKTTPYGMETLRMLSQKMQPDTFTKVLTLSKGMIDDAEKHIAFRKSTPLYTSEQRFDAHHLVMTTPDGKPYRESFKTKDAAMAKMAALEARGYRYLDYVPKSDANLSGQLSDELITSMKELDSQAATRLQEALKDKPDVYAQVVGLTQRASDYEASQAGFVGVPGALGNRRQFVAGREGINMLTNANIMYARYNNWMRHKLVRATTAVDMLHPDLMSNRASMQYAQQHVENQLSTDNELTRKLIEATYNWKLAFNFGVNALHAVQSLTTGMASMISETGGVGDAMKLTLGAQRDVIQRATTGKWGDPKLEWLAQKLASQGHAGIASWSDVYGDPLVKMNEASRSQNPLAQGVRGVQAAANSWTNMFLKFNDQIGAIAGFKLGLERGMSDEDAFRFAVDVKNRGYFTGGKSQRAVGLWSIKSKPVPQLMSSLQTYTFGWFSNLAANWQRGFGTPPVELSATERIGAKKAFLYQLAVQAVMAGAVGLPGVGQGLALMKQTTGVDYKAWLRQHLGELFGEDQDNGGLVTSLALHGLVAAGTPLDPSGRHIPTFPFTGVSPYKGFDIANLATAPVSAASDVVKGLLSAAKGDVQGTKSLLPHVLQGPFDLWQGEGDVRDKKGNLLYQLSPSEKFITALGMTPSRVQNAKDTDAAVKQASAMALAEKSAQIDRLATTYRREGAQAGQRELLLWLRDHPSENPSQLVRAIAAKVEAQTVPQDWRRNTNVAADLSGLSSRMPSSEVQRVQTRQNVAEGLGLFQRPNVRQEALAQEVDDLLNSDPYMTKAEALALLTRKRPNRSPFEFATPAGFQ